MANRSNGLRPSQAGARTQADGRNRQNLNRPSATGNRALANGRSFSQRDVVRSQPLGVRREADNPRGIEFGGKVTVKAGNITGSIGSSGTSIGINPGLSTGTAGTTVKAGPVTFNPDTGSVGFNKTVPLFGPLGFSGGVTFEPHSTEFFGGPSIGIDDLNVSVQGTAKVQTGYIDVFNIPQEIFNSVIAPLGDYRNVVDPFMDGH